MESDSEWEDMHLDNLDSGSSTSVPSSESEEETENDDEPELDEWTEINILTDIPPPSAPYQFTGNSSINDEIASFTTPIQFFNYFFDDELVGKIVSETICFRYNREQHRYKLRVRKLDGAFIGDANFFCNHNVYEPYIKASRENVLVKKK